MADITATLADGIAAARAGRREEARLLLLEVVQADERNEQGWLWLSSVLDRTEDVVTCLENVLFVNPDNHWAREALEIVRVKQVLETGRAEIPTGTPQTSGTARRIGEYLVEKGYLAPQQLREALAQQQRMRRTGQNAPLGEILLQNRFISRDHLAFALESQFMSGGGLTSGAISQLGDYLIRKGYISWSQLAQVIALQADLAQRGQRLRLGEILIQNRMLSRAQLARALEEQFQDYDTQFGSHRS